MQKPKFKVTTVQKIDFPHNTIEGNIEIIKFTNFTGDLYTAYANIKGKPSFSIPHCAYTDDCTLEQIRSNIIKFCRWLKYTVEHMKKIKDASNNKK